jgi:hypothetical protein
VNASKPDRVADGRLEHRESRSRVFRQTVAAVDGGGARHQRLVESPARDSGPEMETSASVVTSVAGISAASHADSGVPPSSS